MLLPLYITAAVSHWFLYSPMAGLDYKFRSYHLHRTLGLSVMESSCWWSEMTSWIVNPHHHLPDAQSHIRHAPHHRSRRAAVWSTAAGREVCGALSGSFCLGGWLSGHAFLLTHARTQHSVPILSLAFSTRVPTPFQLESLCLAPTSLSFPFYFALPFFTCLKRHFPVSASPFTSLPLFISLLSSRLRSSNSFC